MMPQTFVRVTLENLTHFVFGGTKNVVLGQLGISETFKAAQWLVTDSRGEI